MSRFFAPYYELKKMDLTCPKCGWKGKGEELSVSEVFEESAIIEYVCPTCSEDIAFTAGPTNEEHRAHWEECDPLDRLMVELIERARAEKTAT